ncbi:MAG: LD-carboxypeptidase [Candidatus Nealsonbacteria bacterium CG_4_9_14_0_2_um_filter_37_38]|uniref:LD-carboxypeptidase n=1 Tax=Candidatus Nealsonbacteria bacterium CG_4_10_14_0_8_um_filter_37_14 TaxID=1974684 RepID=A0A2M7R593_9BACT|nr:MAG: LD-carboxypeptidase [Candidatus Nealsonbacteria bacterium CG_4_8_14_3_um_filter_37_23]PIY88474.1 MAG: LD-carboxypeptidase [Candidatus Nealsonbacteria bacterium CG_4_10_14_0_8_um_filter_37_14]PJC51559.1 MAG: LD-carboxypeptidase [Candidatus Nealsonbacteria bacterium CG_4_9_14_0_2_um_filter_37_38]
MPKLIKPKLLRKGDTIGIISPSAPLAGLVSHRVKNGVEMIKKMGFKVVLGKNALKVSEYTAGSAEERAQDINDFFGDKKIKAIFSFIGGSHSNQILKHLDFNLIKRNPKIFLGYSDITVLHFALNTQANLVSFYGPAVLTQFAENPEIIPYTKKYLEKTIMNVQPLGKIVPSLAWTDESLDWFKKEDLKRPRRMEKNKGWEWLKKGKGEGVILGGCISSMMHLRGTKYWPDFKNSILFWEISESESDFTKGESPENIDSCLTDLESLGLFKQIKGMIVGRPFGYTPKQVSLLKKIIYKRTKDYNFPILFGVDIGHTDPMITIPLGIKVKLDSAKNVFYFSENGVKE